MQEEDHPPEMASQAKTTTNYQNLNFGKSLYHNYLQAELHAILHIKAIVEAIWVFFGTHATKVVARVYQATTSYYN